jgi:L-alanine-DL-glutamate epimerase-like enolase superfamily enzyme
MVERPIVYKRAIEMFAAIRGEIGDNADIATDFHVRAQVT